jgi:hypothetical protein
VENKGEPKMTEFRCPKCQYKYGYVPTPGQNCTECGELVGHVLVYESELAELHRKAESWDLSVALTSKEEVKSLDEKTLKGWYDDAQKWREYSLPYKTDRDVTQCFCEVVDHCKKEGDVCPEALRKNEIEADAQKWRDLQKIEVSFAGMSRTRLLEKAKELDWVNEQIRVLGLEDFSYNNVKAWRDDAQKWRACEEVHGENFDAIGSGKLAELKRAKQELDAVVARAKESLAGLKEIVDSCDKFEADRKGKWSPNDFFGLTVQRQQSYQAKEDAKLICRVLGWPENQWPEWVN